MGQRASDGPIRKRPASCTSNVEESRRDKELEELSSLASSDQDKFRKRASELGIVTHVKMKWRTKQEILDDYKRKLDEAERAIHCISNVEEEQTTVPSLEELFLSCVQ